MNQSGIPNTTSSVSCQKPAWFFSLGQQLGWILPYYIILSFTVGIGGQCLNLWGFRRQTKTDKAYAYQMLVSACQMLDITAYSTLSTCVNLAGLRIPAEGNGWFMHTYALMIFTGYLVTPLSHCMTMSTVLVSVSMVADRVLACMKPVAYKNINHRKHRMIALGICFSLGFTTTLYNCRLYKVVSSSSYGYVLQPDTAYVISILGTYLAYAANMFRFLSLLCLIGCNIALVRFYKKRLRIAMGRNAGTDRDIQREAKMRAKERSLFILAISQSVFKGITTLSRSAFYLATYTIPTFNGCENGLFAPANNILMMTCEMGDVCATVAANPTARNGIVQVFKRFKLWKSGGVTPMVTPNSH